LRRARPKGIDWVQPECWRENRLWKVIGERGGRRRVSMKAETMAPIRQLWWTRAGDRKVLGGIIARPADPSGLSVRKDE
jgi:hypothetical protein